MSDPNLILADPTWPRMPEYQPQTLAVWPAGKRAVQTFLDDEHVVLLTECCGASGKGSAHWSNSSGVICRACYDPVPPAHGAVYDLSAGWLADLVRTHDLYLLPDEKDELAVAVHAARVAARRDSNDSEIELLRDALDGALRAAGRADLADLL